MTLSCISRGGYHSHTCSLVPHRAAPNTALPPNLLAAGKANQSVLEQVNPEGVIASDINVDPQVKLPPANEVGFVQISAEGSKRQGRVMILVHRDISSPHLRRLGKTKDQMQKPFCTAFPS